MTKIDSRISYRDLQQKMLKFKEQGLTKIACNCSWDALYEEYNRVMSDLEAGSVTVQVSKIEIINETGDEPGDEPGEPKGNPVSRSPKPGDGGSSSDALDLLTGALFAAPAPPPKDGGFVTIPIRTNRHPAIVPLRRLGTRPSQLVDRGVFTA